MLRPQNRPLRESRNLSGVWRLQLDAAGVGRRDRWFAAALPDAQPMAVPASYNDLVTDAATRDFVGDLWYQTDVVILRSWEGSRITVYLESATHRATVWAGESEVGSHEGGYLPFEVDLTEVAVPGEELRLTVCVNNTLTFESIPPGVIDSTPRGPRQRYFHDFYNYAGLHRPVWLTRTGRIRLDDVTVVTGLTDSGEVVGLVDYDVTVVPDTADVTVGVTLCDAEGVEVASGPDPVAPGSRLPLPTGGARPRGRG